MEISSSSRFSSGVPGEHHRVGRGDALDARAPSGVPVLDALRLVEDDQVRRPGIDQVESRVHHVVVDDLAEASSAAYCRLALAREARR